MRDLLVSFASRVYMLLDRQPRLAVVTLHRVGNSAKMRPEGVERLFAFLSRRYQLILPSQLERADHHGRLASVTIDDGHADTYKHIFPIAEALGVPVSLCVPTDFFFRSEWLWFDKLAWAMSHAKPGTGTDADGVAVRGGDPRSFDEIKRRLKRCQPQRRSDIIDGILSGLQLMLPPKPPEQYRSVSETEMREMLNTGLVEVVGHSVTHTIATILSEQDLRRELHESKDELEGFCGQPITAFCYPNGHRGDFDCETTEALRRAGYHMAFTSVEGTNPLSRLRPFALKRVHANPRQFVSEKLCSGLGDLQKKLTGNADEET